MNDREAAGVVSSPDITMDTGSMIVPENGDEDVLVCAFQLRPRGAPSLFEVGPHVQSLVRQEGALVVEFDPTAAEMVSEYTAAERLCCPTITWTLEIAPIPRLRVVTTPGRLDTIEAMFVMARAQV